MIDFKERLSAYIKEHSNLCADYWLKRAYFDEENNLIYLEVVELYIKLYFKYAFEYIIEELLKERYDFPDLKIVQIDPVVNKSEVSEI